MKFDTEIFSHQYLQVEGFVRHLAYERGMQRAISNRECGTAFWAKTSDAHLMNAALYWCKVFGAEGLNSTHWKKTAITDALGAQDAFRQALYTKPGMNQMAWKTCWDEICHFRDTFVAHLDIGKIEPIPSFDKALLVALVYDDWVRALIAPDIIQHPKFEEMYSNWEKDSFNVVNQALSTGPRS